MGSLEGTTKELSDNAFTRENPVGKCGMATMGRSLKLFGISLGYCISGSNLLRDYQWKSSESCQDGKGGYGEGSFIIDLYEITNGNTFRDAIINVESTTAYSLGPNKEDNSTGSGEAVSLLLSGAEELTNRAMPCCGLISSFSLVIGVIIAAKNLE